MKHRLKNKKINYLFVLLFFGAAMLISDRSIAQSAAINTTGASADPSAALDIQSTTQGLLIPRMTTAQRSTINQPAPGLMVYQTDAPAGYYYYNGTAWEQ